MTTALDRRANLPARLAEPTASFWRTLSAARRSRIFHPKGDAFEAVFGVPGGAGTGVDLFDQPGTYAAIVRLSRGGGFPKPLPDVLGIGLRLRDVHGPGRHQDLLMNASVDVPVLHHLMIPLLSAEQSRTFSSILPYKVGAKTVLIGALRERGEHGFRLALAPPFGKFTPVGTVTFGTRLPGEVSETLKLNPWNTGGGIAPFGPFQAVRAAAYRGSQQGRAAHG